eukprot:TRINITY_DN3576_c0_g1_i6.p1 TRINITY_DN3576_c0_g1~~TRINITY_DN3576_c0_g1_i6.p1  ORF type:complete len:427 (-),score=51.44 TRINITY_DN3576_c0_g1_i6:234-1514(-)
MTTNQVPGVKSNQAVALNWIPILGFIPKFMTIVIQIALLHRHRLAQALRRLPASLVKMKRKINRSTLQNQIHYRKLKKLRKRPSHPNSCFEFQDSQSKSLSELQIKGQTQLQEALQGNFLENEEKQINATKFDEQNLKQTPFNQEIQGGGIKMQCNEVDENELRLKWKRVLEDDKFFTDVADDICRNISNLRSSHPQNCSSQKIHEETQEKLFSITQNRKQSQNFFNIDTSLQQGEQQMDGSQFGEDDIILWNPQVDLPDVKTSSDKIDKAASERNKKFAKQLMAPPLQHRRLLKEQREKMGDTKGKHWYDLPATTITPELARDLKVIRLRQTYDPKRFYKSFESDNLPKYFQIGTVVEGPADFYSGRLPKRYRRSTITEELLADPEFNQQRKKRFDQIKDEHDRHLSQKKALKKAQKKAAKILKQ